MGLTGAMGLTGPMGPQCPSGNLALAGQICPPGKTVTGFDVNGAILCTPVAFVISPVLTLLDSAGDVGQYTSIAIGADGLPVISYYDGANTDLKVAHCGSAACAGGNTLTTVDSAGVVGSSTSIAIGADGFPVISYYDNTNGDLKAAHCHTFSCSP